MLQKKNEIAHFYSHINTWVVSAAAASALSHIDKYSSSSSIRQSISKVLEGLLIYASGSYWKCTPFRAKRKQILHKLKNT